MVRSKGSVTGICWVAQAQRSFGDIARALGSDRALEDGGGMGGDVKELGPLAWSVTVPMVTLSMLMVTVTAPVPLSGSNVIAAVQSAKLPVTVDPIWRTAKPSSPSVTCHSDAACSSVATGAASRGAVASA